MSIIKTLKVTAIIVLPAFLLACAGTPPAFTEAPTALAACPSSPNCVSSKADNSSDQFIEPIRSPLNMSQQYDRLHALLSTQENAVITAAQPNYIRAEFTSAFWGFVDDVEFILAGTEIHMRSASRLGYSDLGANRNRLERLRSEF